MQPQRGAARQNFGSDQRDHCDADRHDHEAQRGDIARLNQSLRDGLVKKGLQVNAAAPAPFRDRLHQAGFYTDWHKKFGDTAWHTLESAVGRLT